MYSFVYTRPNDLNGIKALSSESFHYLAGGQSLVQAMKLRLAQPEKLVDLGAISELQGISKLANALRVGAMATHAQVAQSALVASTIPALAKLAGGIGDPMVRNQGTVGGSLANADPAACYPSALLALDGVVVTNERRIPAKEFFLDLYQTCLRDGELIVAVEFAIPVDAAYVKLKHPASRFALVGVFVARHADGVRVGVTGAKACAYREASVERVLNANFALASLDQMMLSEQGMNADIHCSASYRAAMVLEMSKRAVQTVLAAN
jgi:aerobic carbon-monoxide dehydrogenase medium subunit